MTVPTPRDWRWADAPRDPGALHNVDQTGGILALDIGLKVGWAHLPSGATGCLDLSREDDHGRMLANYHGWLAREIAWRQPALLAVEQAGFARHVNAIGITTLAMGRIAHMLAWSQDIRRTEAMARLVRTWLIGPYSKMPVKILDACIRAAVETHGLHPADEHAADAAALALYVRHQETARVAS